MSRSLSLLTNPIAPMVGIILATALLLTDPCEPGAWAILVGAGSWLLSGFVVRMSRATPDRQQPAEAADALRRRLPLLVGMLIGGVVGAAVLESLGWPAVLIGTAAAAGASGVASVVDKTITREATRTPPTWFDMLTAAVATAVGLGLAHLLIQG